MANFWSNLAKAVPGTVEGFYKGRKMTQDAEQQKLENLYKQKKLAQDEQAFGLDQLFKNQQIAKMQAESAPIDASWAAGQKDLAGLFPEGTDFKNISRTDPRLEIAKTRLSRDPLERDVKLADIESKRATTKKTLGEIPADPQQIAKTDAEIELLRARAQNMGASDPAQARLMLARAENLELKNKAAKTAPAKEYKKEQYDAAGFSQRMRQSEDVFSELEKGGFDRTSAGSGFQAMLPGRLQSGNIKAQEQAERNFINAALRRESGASISPGEFESAEQQYFPRGGDTPQVLAQKRANRQQTMASVGAAAGGAMGQVPYVNPSEARAAAARKPVVQAPANGPAVGAVVDGYKFIGGDPANPRSWSKP